jgi:hypothetical protein
MRRNGARPAVCRIGLYAALAAPSRHWRLGQPVTMPRADNARPASAIPGGQAAFLFEGLRPYLFGGACRPFAVKTKPYGAENGGRVVAALRPAPSAVFRSGRQNPRSLPRG